MKTLVLYASKYGATREVANRIASRIGGADVHDLKQANLPDLAGYDCIVVGGSLYAGMVRREVKSYVRANEGALLKLKFGLFLCGMDVDNADNYFKKNFSAEINRAAKAKAILGGTFDPEKASFIDRMIINAVKKSQKYFSNINDERIDNYINELIK